MRIQKHRRKTWLLLTLAAIGVITWLLWPPAPPAIEFVEFRDTDNRRRAVFKIVNRSSSPFYYQAITANYPAFIHENRTFAGWDRPSPAAQEIVYQLITTERNSYASIASPPKDEPSSFSVAPHSEVEIIVSPLLTLIEKEGAGIFRIGIFFSRTLSPESVSGEPGRIGKAINWLRIKMGRKPREKQPTWSEPVQDTPPPKTNVPFPPSFMSPPLPDKVKGLAAM